MFNPPSGLWFVAVEKRALLPCFCSFNSLLLYKKNNNSNCRGFVFVRLIGYNQTIDCDTRDVFTSTRCASLEIEQRFFFAVPASIFSPGKLTHSYEDHQHTNNYNHRHTHNHSDVSHSSPDSLNGGHRTLSLVLSEDICSGRETEP